MLEERTLAVLDFDGDWLRPRRDGTTFLQLLNATERGIGLERVSETCAFTISERISSASILGDSEIKAWKPTSMTSNVASSIARSYRRYVEL